MFCVRNLALLSLVCVCLLGCGNGDSAEADIPDPEFGLARIGNFVSDAGPITVREEDESLVTALLYSASSAPLQGLPGSFEVSFSYETPTDPIHFLDEAIDLEVDMLTNLMILGTVGDEVLLRFTDALLDPETNAEQGRLRFINASSMANPLDFYLTDPEASVDSSTPTASLSFGEVDEGSLVAASTSYRLRITASGSTDVIYDTGTISLFALEDLILVAFDDTGAAQLRVRLIGLNGTSLLVDQTADASVRLFNGIADVAGIDVYQGDTSGSLLFEDIAFQELSGRINLAPGTDTLTVTTTGVPSEVLWEEDLVLSNADLRTIYIGGAITADDLNSREVLDVIRPVAVYAQVGFVNLATSGTAIDVYIGESGVAIADLTPILSNIPPFTSIEAFPLSAGDYDITITETGSAVILLDPLPLTFATSELHTLVLTEADGGGTPPDLVTFTEIQ